MERSNIITMNGNPATLLGPELKPGDTAPNFTALTSTVEPVTLDQTTGKARFISVVPSLDTAVCDLQTVTISKKAGPDQAESMMYTISVDLPFAQGRYCDARAIHKVQFLSDHRDLDFGMKYGLVIKELRLLARALIVIDQNETIRHLEIVPEVSTEPNYEAAFEVLNTVLNNH